MMAKSPKIRARERDTIVQALAAVDADWPGGYTAGARAARVPGALTDERLQDAVLAALDRIGGERGQLQARHPQSDGAA